MKTFSYCFPRGNLSQKGNSVRNNHYYHYTMQTIYFMCLLLLFLGVFYKSMKTYENIKKNVDKFLFELCSFFSQ